MEMSGQWKYETGRTSPAGMQPAPLILQSPVGCARDTNPIVSWGGVVASWDWVSVQTSWHGRPRLEYPGVRGAPQMKAHGTVVTIIHFVWTHCNQTSP